MNMTNSAFEIQAIREAILVLNGENIARYYLSHDQ